MSSESIPNSGLLLIRVRSVYGTLTIYPANETASLIAKIAGTKTLTHQALVAAEKLGFSVEVQPEPLPASVAQWASK